MKSQGRERKGGEKEKVQYRLSQKEEKVFKPLQPKRKKKGPLPYIRQRKGFLPFPCSGRREGGRRGGGTRHTFSLVAVEKGRRKGL